MLTLTAQRRDEVAHMTWNEVNLDAGLWIIPKERATNDQAHHPFLAPIAEAPAAPITGGGFDSMPRIFLVALERNAPKLPSRGWEAIDGEQPCATLTTFSIRTLAEVLPHEMFGSPNRGSGSVGFLP
ncbi:hypothetical protein [Azospirillum sp. TSO22-1]|uniref:hypothetical protein n=1 Tax=Azospirillum sp. TSO22-1 TaxID=716789 RepID=UPI0011B619BE|nr:hypothetical protein [Azospirillum sp. TSO22-1]